jgi:hypothetical protein
MATRPGDSGLDGGLDWIYRLLQSSARKITTNVEACVTILMLLSRTLLFGLGFFSCAGLFSLVGIRDPMAAARAWWPI